MTSPHRKPHAVARIEIQQRGPEVWPTTRALNAAERARTFRALAHAVLAGVGYGFRPLAPRRIVPGVRFVGLVVAFGMPVAILFPTRPWLALGCGLWFAWLRSYRRSLPRKPPAIHRNMDLREAAILERGRNRAPTTGL